MRNVSNSKVSHLFRELPGIVLPLLLVVAAMAGTLRLLSLVPAQIKAQAEARQYATVKEVESALGLKVLVPAYFPDYLSWPADKITVRRRPAIDISLHFLSRDGSQEALTIRQIVWSGEGEPPVAVPPPDEVLQQQYMPVGDSQGILLMGRSAAGGPVNQLRWQQGDRYIVVTTVHPLEELLRMAESMAH